MNEWFVFVPVAIGVIAGVIGLVSGARGTEPRDLTVLSLAVVELVLIVHAVTVIVLAFGGTSMNGDPLEYWMYLVTALLLPPLVGVWAIVDKTRLGTLAIGGAALSVAIMLVRMSVIWVGN